MSRTGKLNPVLLMSAQSLASAFTTPPTAWNLADNIDYQINVTTTNSTGAFAFQISMDYNPGGGTQPAAAGNWTTVGAAGVVAAANDTITVEYNQTASLYTRLAYTPTVAGTGTANVYVAGKAVGA